MRVEVKRCRTCGALGIGPHAIKLRVFEGRWYCDEHWKAALDWHTNREAVVQGLGALKGFHEDVRKGLPVKKKPRTDWYPLIRELSGMAGLALEHGDKRGFVHYFARAVQAWALMEAGNV